MAGIHLVASLGGHLDLLRATAPATDERTWVTSEGVAAAGLRAAGERVLTLQRLDSGSARLGSLVAGARLAVKERPSIVITSGAGLAVPFCLTARLMGARLVHVETMARVTSGSRTGRLLSRFAAAVLVQWEELGRVYPRAELCRPALLEAPALTPGSSAGPEDRAGAGTFVTVGSHDQPFMRLLRAVEDAARAGVLPKPVVVQRGVAEPLGDEVRDMDFMPKDDFDQAMRNAAVIVAHVGAGAVATAVRLGRRPIVVPRLRSHGEHVDDHQLQLAAKLDDLELAVLVEDRITHDHVRAAQQPVIAPDWSDLPRVQDRLAELVGGLSSDRG